MIYNKIMKVPSKKDLRKLSDWLWEIPKDFREDMRVPARIYASEKMLEETEGEALVQLVNLSTLPGVQKYALAMPDAHTGYASPIGGVAAIRVTDGIISPGLCGYDINCLCKDAKILHSFGYYLSIQKLERRQLEEIKCVDFQERKIKNAKFFNFFKRKAKEVLKIVTKTGREIKATPDHPFYTPRGMIKAEKLNPGDKIAVYPFEGVPYENPSKEIIIDEKDIEKTLKKIGVSKKSKRYEIILRKLKKRNLLPLTYDHPKLPYILKIMGFVFGDASMNFIGKRGDGVFCFAGRPEDLKEAREDLKKIGYTPSPIHYRKRKDPRTGKYSDSYFFFLNASSFVVLLETLGVPRGKKVNQAFRVPKWIFKCPLWQKRLFLAALFGSELRCPHCRVDRRGNFNAPSFTVGKIKDLIENGKKYLQDISELLREFGVKTLYIEMPESKRHVNTKGEISYGLNLIFSPSLENLLNLWGKIGFEYNKERSFFANVAVQYLKLKQKVIQEKEEAIKITIPQLLKKGLSYQKIANQLATGNPLAKRFVIDVCWKLNKGIKKIKPRITPSFPLFEDYLQKATQNLGKSGVVWDEIEKIEKIPYQGFVYDFTVDHQDHNFIANNFVVSNCGMKLLKSEYTEKEIKPYLEKLAIEIQKEVPSGLGKGRKIKLSIEEINKILEGGAQRIVEKGYGEKEDLENCESEGKLPFADASVVSFRAKNRGRDQVGTLGSGNHFIEIQKVAEIFNEKVAKVFGLFKDQIVIMIHTGSRGLGHQVCSDYLREFIPLMLHKYKIKVPDKEFACVPFNSPEGQRYFSAMASAANYAWANRQMIAHFVRKAWRSVLGKKAGKLVVLYDVAHNIIKREKYKIDGKEVEVVVHRKGATRAFPPDHPELPKKYKKVGQPVLIPGSMGTASYVLVGTKKGESAFFSTCHGAGRRMSRKKAIKTISGYEVVRNLERKGIIVKCYSMRGVAEEAPQAYKNIDDVVEVVDKAGLSKKVAKLSPLAVIKGE